jgi:hypothetical protein
VYKGGPHPSSIKKKREKNLKVKSSQVKSFKIRANRDAGIGTARAHGKTLQSGASLLQHVGSACGWTPVLLTMSTTVLIPAGDLKAYTAACLVAAGSLKGNAELVAEVSKVVVPCSANLVT